MAEAEPRWWRSAGGVGGESARFRRCRPQESLDRAVEWRRRAGGVKPIGAGPATDLANGLPGGRKDSFFGGSCRGSKAEKTAGGDRGGRRENGRTGRHNGHTGCHDGRTGRHNGRRGNNAPPGAAAGAAENGADGAAGVPFQDLGGGAGSGDTLGPEDGPAAARTLGSGAGGPGAPVGRDCRHHRELSGPEDAPRARPVEEGARRPLPDSTSAVVGLRKESDGAAGDESLTDLGLNRTSYGNKKAHRIEFINESAMIIITDSLFLCTDLVGNPKHRYNIGSGKSGARGPKWAHGHQKWGTRAPNGHMGTKIGAHVRISHQLSMGAKAREPIWADKDDVEDAVGEDLGEDEENSEQSLDGPCGGVPESENGGGGEARAGKGFAVSAGKEGGGRRHGAKPVRRLPGPGEARPPRTTMTPRSVVGPEEGGVRQAAREDASGRAGQVDEAEGDGPGQTDRK